MGHLPSWLSYTEKEKMEWLNTIMEEVWPFVDKGVVSAMSKQEDASCPVNPPGPSVMNRRHVPHAP